MKNGPVVTTNKRRVWNGATLVETFPSKCRFGRSVALRDRGSIQSLCFILFSSNEFFFKL